MAAFYSLLLCFFYRRRVPHRDRFNALFALLRVRCQVEEIVDRMPQILFAAEISFCRLHGRMPQQELYLFQLATTDVAQLGTSSPQVVRCDMLQARSLTGGSDHVPDNILRDAKTPSLSRPPNSSKNPSLRDPGCQRPLIECIFDPFGNWYGADVAALANQIHDCPVPLAHLEIIQLQADQF